LYQEGSHCTEKDVSISQAGILYQKSANMLEKHLIGICNYFENRITNGLIEGMNTKIKLIKRKSYGFANFEHLQLKLLACFNS
jgi:transposase